MRRQPDGRAHAYSPHRNRDENAAVMASQLAEARDPATALNYLAATLDKADRRQLTRRGGSG